MNSNEAHSSLTTQSMAHASSVMPACDVIEWVSELSNRVPASGSAKLRMVEPGHVCNDGKVGAGVVIAVASVAIAVDGSLVGVADSDGVVGTVGSTKPVVSSSPELSPDVSLDGVADWHAVAQPSWWYHSKPPAVKASS